MQKASDILFHTLRLQFTIRRLRAQVDAFEFNTSKQTFSGTSRDLAKVAGSLYDVEVILNTGKLKVADKILTLLITYLQLLF
jgi:hypothetical protein